MSFDGLRLVHPLRLGLALAVVLAGACERSSPPSEPLTLAQIDGGDAAKASGKKLMSLPFGLHRLDTTSPAPDAAVIGVHGYDSEGYEWAYPLKATDSTDTRVYFHRYDFTQCPEPMAKALDDAIDRLLADDPGLKSLRLLSHSYGGIVSTMVAARYDGRVPLTVDVVASPLAGAPRMSERCSYEGPSAPAEGVTLRQWRTIHELDKALDDIEPDPQVVDLPGQVTRLPDSYEGHRLGHNWSISWVVDELAGGTKP